MTICVGQHERLFHASPVQQVSGWKAKIEEESTTYSRENDAVLGVLNHTWPVDHGIASSLGRSVRAQVSKIRSDKAKPPPLQLLSEYLAFLAYKTTSNVVRLLSSNVVPRYDLYFLVLGNLTQAMPACVALQQSEQEMETVRSAFGRLEKLWIELEMSKLVEKHNGAPSLSLFSLLKLRDNSSFVAKLSKVLDDVVRFRPPRGYQHIGPAMPTYAERNLLRVWVQTN